MMQKGSNPAAPTELEVALALALIKQRDANAKRQEQELAYLRGRLSLVVGEAEAAADHEPLLLMPPSHTLLVRWLEAQGSDDPSRAARSGVVLLTEVMRPSGSPAAWANDAGVQALSRVLARTIELEKVATESGGGGWSELPTLGLSQWLCDSAATVTAADASPAWLGAVQTLLVLLTRAHGHKLLRALAYSTRWLVSTVAAGGGNADGYEPKLLGMQPVLGALQEALASLGAADAPKARAHQAVDESDWRQLLQEAFDGARGLTAACPLLAHAVWHLSLLASRVPPAAGRGGGDATSARAAGMLGTQAWGRPAGFTGANQSQGQGHGAGSTMAGGAVSGSQPKWRVGLAPQLMQC